MRSSNDSSNTKELTSLFLLEINKELIFAREKFPGRKHNFAALSEEHGELANALIEHDRGSQASVDVWREAIQVAVMAIRVGTEGDSSFKYSPSSIHNEKNSERSESEHTM